MVIFFINFFLNILKNRSSPTTFDPPTLICFDPYHQSAKEFFGNLVFATLRIVFITPKTEPSSDSLIIPSQAILVSGTDEPTLLLPLAPSIVLLQPMTSAIGGRGSSSRLGKWPGTSGLLLHSPPANWANSWALLINCEAQN